jgi:DNA-binding response OmpR family regulator
MNANKTSHAEEPAAPPARGGSNSPHRILVVDDDISIRQLNTAVLSRSGYHVDAAEDGAVAWDTLQLNRYDLVVTDNHMPKMSGLELLKELRAARLDLPVIMATGTLPMEEFARHTGIQPAAMLLKPYTITELLGAVAEVLRATESARERIQLPPREQSQPSADGLRL